MFLNHLKMETSPQHRAIEQQIDLRRICGSRAAYTAHLARLYGFYQPLEEALWRTEAVREAGVTGERRKVPLLLRDLCVLGVKPQEQPLCKMLPPFEKEGEAMGCLYVLEGASLGGQVITRLVRERLGIGTQDGGSFFSGYGEKTAVMWATFRASLEDYAHSPQRQEAIVGAARATFETLGVWLSREERRH